MTAHLDDGTIAAMVAGTLPPDDRARAAEHVDACATCRDLVGEAALATATEIPGYVLGEEVARGAMGRIVEARDLELGRPVALKQLIDPTPALIRRFEREVAITAALQHPGIVPVYRAGTLRDGEPFYAMRRVRGRGLDMVIAEATTLAQRLAILPRVLAAVDAVAYAHAEGVIHRDLKPQNILAGDYGEVVVIDWGLAKRLGDVDEPGARETADAALTSDGTVLGTPAYMAPEQAAGGAVDARADVYALGAVLYHVLAGRPPHGAGTLSQTLDAVRAGRIEPLPAEIAPDLRAIVTRAMATLPSERYGDAAALAADLRQFLAGRLVAAHAYTPWQLARRWLGKHRAWVAAATLLVVGGATMTAVSFTRIRHERDTARVERESAETLVHYTISDVFKALDDSGQQEQIDALGKRIVAYYDGVLAVRPDDKLSRAYRAMALDMQANAAYRLGDLDRAQTIWTEVIPILREAQTVAPDAALDVGLSESNLGNLARLRGDSAGAEKAYRAAIADLEPAYGKEPALAGSALAGAIDGIVQMKMGALDTQAAQPLAARALEVAKHTAEVSPKDSLDAQERYAQIAYSNASLDAIEGRDDHARQLLALATATLQGLPPDPSGIMSLGFQHFTLASIERATGHLDAAGKALADARDAIKTAAAGGFDDPQLERLAVMLELEDAQQQLAGGRAAQALAAADRGLAAVDALIAKQPKVQQFQRDRAVALAIRARAHAPDAASAIHAVIATLEPLATTARGKLELAYALAASAELDVDADASLARATKLVDELAPSVTAHAPIAHARAYLAAVRAHRDPAARDAYRTARAEVAAAPPLTMPTIAELDRLAGI